MDLPGDSLDYDLLYRSAEKATETEGLFCEIGTRRGGSLKYIIDAVTKSGKFRHIIAIDPYGNIDYAPSDNVIQKFDYTNDMKNESMPNIYSYARNKPVNIVFFNLEDKEFFKRFDTGVPVYHENKEIINNYSFVFFDGPHDKESIFYEVLWFLHRIVIGSVFVFDDVNSYDHDYIDQFLIKNGFERMETGIENRKISYIKVQ